MNQNGLALEETMVETLEALPGLAGRIAPVIDIQLSSGPLVVYDQTGESESKTVAGRSGLMTADFEIHCMSGTYRSMRQLSEAVKERLLQLTGYQSSRILIEDVNATLASPDIREKNVGLFRRTYRVHFDYQLREETKL